ncbi:hypothetical protein Sango_2127900, partial [Sesamum angolense]
YPPNSTLPWSARSLAGSDTPPTQCYIKARSGPPALDHHSHSSSDEDDNDNNESVFPPPSSKTATQPRQIPRQLPTQFYTAVVKEETEPLQPKLQNGGTASTNASIEVPRRRDFYFMSARSLAGSNTPPTQCYIKARSGPPALDHHSHSSSDEDDYDNNNNKESVFPPPSSKTATQPRQIPRQVKYGTFVAAASSLPLLGEALRRALEAQPQLQIKRGNVEGLNPLMFVFALIANATYTGSILVRNTEWRMIKANMPWLLDAIVCVGLDLFIILQCIFYKYVKLKKREEYYSDYVEADKPA